MYDIALSPAFASPLSGKSHGLSYSKLLLSVVCLREQYLLVYTDVTEKYGEQQ